MDIFNKINMRGNKIDNCPDTDINNKEIEFQEAKNRENIKSNEKVPIIFGKIAKWLTDLGIHLKDEIVHVSDKEREKWNKATQVTIISRLTTGTKVGTICIDGTEYDLYCQTNTDHDTWKANTKDDEGYVAKGNGQANMVWKTDANGNPGWREDENTQAVKSVNDKTGAVTLTAADVKAIPTSDKIDKLTNIRQITRLGYWAISAIDNTYAASIGVDNNTGDFHALVLSYNGNGTDKYNFGTIILSSPRLGAYHYVIQVWEGTAHAERMLNFSDITNSAAVNVAGKKALDAIEKNASVAGTLANQLQQVNSNIEECMRVNNHGANYNGDDVISAVRSHPPGNNLITLYLFGNTTPNVPDNSGWWSILSYRINDDVILYAVNTWSGKFASAHMSLNGTETQINWHIYQSTQS